MYPGATSIVGKEIDGYRIEGILGRGGMGIVYKAENQNLGRMVALKVITPELAEDEEFLKRFRREARALAQLNHPHIVLIYALRQADLGLYIAMEYVEGQTLADHLQTHSPIAWPQALPLIKQLLSALGYAHERGIIHRDLKPRNIMLTEQGEVKVMDFGLAKILGKGSGETTVTGARGGTLCYMSPEQARGLKNVDHLSDLFSLGLTLYEVLAGRLPFKKDESDFTILKAIVEEKFPSPHSFNRTLPRRLSKILMKALEKNPAKRYQSAGEMLAAIEAFEKQEPTPDEATHVAALPLSDLPKKRTRGLRLAAVAVVLVALSLAGYLFLPTLTGLLSSTERTSGSSVTADPPEDEQGDLAAEEQGEEPAALIPSTPEELPQDQPEETAQDEQDDPVAEAQREEPAALVPSTPEEPPQDQPEEVADTEAVAPTGTLRIRSEPQGARFVLDGDRSGTTPSTIPDVPVGGHTIVWSLDGYEPLTRSVTVVAEQTHTMNPPLVPITGTLEVSVRPSGRVSIDGVVARDQVSESTSIDVPVGRHTVTIEHPDYGRWQREVIISTDTPTPITVDFTREVSVTVIALDKEEMPVRGGQIYVDGEDVGSSPRTIMVPVGLRTIEVRVDGYELDGDAPVINFENDWEEALPIRLRKIDQ